MGAVMAAALPRKPCAPLALVLAACLFWLAASPATPGADASACKKWGDTDPTELRTGQARKAITCLVNKQRQQSPRSTRSPAPFTSRFRSNHIGSEPVSDRRISAAPAEAPNHKHQTPNKLQFRNSNEQNRLWTRTKQNEGDGRHSVWNIGPWGLGVCLRFGACNLVLVIWCL